MKFVKRSNGFEYSTIARYDEPLDCFFAFTYWDGDFWSAHRRHFLFPPHQWENIKWRYMSDIIVTKWNHNTEGDLEPCWQKKIGSGNDPRVAIVADRMIVLFRGAITSDSEYYVYDVTNATLVTLKCEQDWFTFGKNWAPFESDGCLGAIHSFAPLKAYNIDITSGLCSPALEIQQPIVAPASHDGYNMLRGGTNAFSIESGKFIGGLFGLGHLTMKPWRHYPFNWRLSSSGKLEFELNQEFAGLANAGYGIIDPTSLFLTAHGTLMVALCASERDWFFEQAFLNVICEANVATETERPSIRVDLMPWDNEPPVLHFTATELQWLVPSEPVAYGARKVISEGYVLCGPYCKLDQGNYEIRLRYRSASDSRDEIGIIDAGVSRPSFYAASTEIRLQGSDDTISNIDFKLEWKGEGNYVLGIRVYLTKPVELIVYDFRIAKLK